jgi:hypothetical protein
VLLAQGFQLCDPSASLFCMIAQLMDLLHGFVENLGQGTGQLYLIRQASHVVMTFGRQHHSIDSFMGLAQKMLVLGMLHLVVVHMVECGQGFACSIANSTLERPPRGGSLDHLVNTVDMVGHRPLVQDHPYMPHIGVLMKSHGSLYPSDRSSVRRVLEK